MNDNYTLKIGIIGGTGLDRDETILQDRAVIPAPETPFGPPSDPELIKGQIDGVEVYVLGRHGRDHRLSPSAVNYRANLWALRALGVTHVLATTASGSLRENMAPGDLAVVDQYIDRTIRGGRSCFTVAHIPQSRPFNRRLQQILLESARDAGHVTHRAVTAVVIEGPRFSSAAESRLYRSWNADLVNMTICPETPLASELGLLYASLALVTDYDCWHDGDGDEPHPAEVSVQVVTETLRTLSEKAKEVLIRAIGKIKREDWSADIARCRAIAKNSIMVE